MRKKWLLVLTMGFMLFSLASGSVATKEKAEQTKPKVQAKQEHPVSIITKLMTGVLTKKLHVKNIVGDPVKVGKVTLIPVIMMDIGYGGGGGGPQMGKEQGGSGFYMSGEAKPLGFIVITKAGAKFLSVGKIPRK